MIDTPSCQPAPAELRGRRLVSWLSRHRRLSALVPVALLVMGTPHSCPYC